MDMASKRGITNFNGNEESAVKRAGHGGSQENVKEVFTDDNHDDADNDAGDVDADDDADDAMSAARRMSRRCSPVTTTAGFH